MRFTHPVPDWASAPYAIRRERVEELLGTKRPSPRNREAWYARIRALQTVERDWPDGQVRERLKAEIGAMLRARDVQLERSSLGARAHATADEMAMLDCEIRAPEVRGLTKFQCGHQRICFVDGKPLPPRRQYWCSAECVALWLSNHEWSAASYARLKADHRTCQRCGYVANGVRVMEVNHIVPRVGAGYHQGCHHHQDGLETLCHPCHVIETTRQGRERRGLPQPGPGLFDPVANEHRDTAD